MKKNIRSLIRQLGLSAAIVIFSFTLTVTTALCQEATKKIEKESSPKTGDTGSNRKKNGKQSQEKAKLRISWFPSWPTPSFDWGLNPIVGFGARADSTESIETTTVVSELGLQLDLRGVPLVVGNPGLYLNPSTAYATGNMYSIVKSGDETHEVNSNFDRDWIRANFLIYWKFYRHILGITRGKIAFSGDVDRQTQSLNILNDMGVRILSFISSHLTLNYLTVYDEDLSKPRFAENDHWFHINIGFNVLDSFLNFGPGYSETDVYGQSGDDWRKTNSGTTKYFLALGGMDFFWKFKLNARAKYVFDAIGQFDGTIAKTDLPTHNVSEPASLATLPADSLEYDVFIGAKQIIGGLGFGWKYYVLMLNYQEQGDKERETLTDQGYTITYSLTF